MSVPSDASESLDESVSLPRIVSRKVGSEGLLLTLYIHEDLIYFSGHFDSLRILPGIVQLKWVTDIASQSLELSSECDFKVQKAKFTNPMYPKQTVELLISLNVESRKIRFKYFNGEETFSSGVLGY